MCRSTLGLVAGVIFCLALLVGMAAMPVSGEAATLRVSPTRIHVHNGALTAALRIWNDGKDTMNAQVRVFALVQKNGKQALIPTRDVVASPPLTKLTPKTENITRLARVAKTPVAAKETYRVVVDQLPSGNPTKSGTVEVLIRQVIPLTFE